VDAEVLVRDVKRIETRSGKTLDGIEPAPERAAGSADDADEVAWRTAVEAAPWLLGTREPGDEIAPDDLYEKLEPFKRRVAEDIREGDEPAES
jgi:hypothetical protein